jgi:hypothetical protein
MSTYNFLIEQTSVVNSDAIKILAENKLPDGRSKIIFKNRLQEADVRNNNRRIYPMAVCESIVEQLGPKAHSRSLLMEVDHPLFVSPDQEILKRRAGVVEINNCGALLRNVYLNGNQIIGEAETLSGFKGPDIADLISKDKVDIGFSLRALGAVESLQDGTLRVKTPIRPINN